MDCRIHPSDERLFECYFASRCGEAADIRDAEHLAGCGECAARYRELTGLMTEVRAEADAEVDELFPLDRLQDQHDQIMQRLAHVHRTARVIAFPASQASAAASAPSRIPSRWLAGAAAAGLFIGVALGGFFGTGTFRGQPEAATQTTAAPAANTVPSLSAAADLRDDDAFLMELEAALATPSPQLRELQSFEALTPHVREISARVR
ncbi:MAG: hypothetical protein AB7Q29_05855 [Vicinamibacterales bacterium]